MNPISRRPREITSMIDISSATRSGSLRFAMGVPNPRSRARLVWRARMASVRCTEALMQVAGAEMLVEVVVEPALAREHPFVEVPVVEAPSDLRIAMLVGKADAQRFRILEPGIGV